MIATQTRHAQIDTQVAENIAQSIHIPPCPGIVVALMEEARRPNVDFAKLVALVGGDVSLAAAMLKTANSPFFGLRRNVDSVQQAVAVLGLKNLMTIVTGAALQNALGGNNPAMEWFWDHCNATAVVASHMASRVDGVSREDAYTLGLFHDGGIPILMQKFPDYKAVFAASNRSGELVVAVEDQHYATNHAVVGSILARNWHLPPHIAHAILMHHDHTIFTEPDGHATPTVCALVGIVRVAEHIAAAFLGTPDDAEQHAGARAAQNFLGLGAGELADIAEDALADLEEIRVLTN